MFRSWCISDSMPLQWPRLFWPMTCSQVWRTGNHCPFVTLTSLGMPIIFSSSCVSIQFISNWVKYDDIKTKEGLLYGLFLFPVSRYYIFFSSWVFWSLQAPSWQVCLGFLMFVVLSVASPGRGHRTTRDTLLSLVDSHRSLNPGDSARPLVC